jgi:hypothetical protein
MVGLGGLGPPTSPLSGAEVSEDCAMIQEIRGEMNGEWNRRAPLNGLGANLKHHT